MKRLLAILGVLFVVAAACSDEEGGDGEPERSEGQKLAAQAKDALATAESVHVAGTVVGADDEITLDLVSGQDGGGGSMTFRSFDLEIRLVDDTSYLQGPADFWVEMSSGKLTPQNAAAFVGKWVKASPEDDLGSLSEFADAEKFADQLISDSDDKIEVGETKTIEGREAVALTKPEKDTGTLYVATDDTHQPVALIPPDATDGLTFTDYDQADPVEAPPANQVVELSSD